MKSNFIIITLAALIAACSGDEPTSSEHFLPPLGQKDVLYTTVDGKEVADTIYHTIRYFEYLNQDSVLITSESMKGKVWISDFFFTHCPTICPPMTSQMKRLNSNLSDLSDEIQFMSFSIDPKKDTPSRLREYRKEHGIDAENWEFFTGDEAETHELGVKYFLVHAGVNDDEPGGFAHGDIFTLVDKEGRVRGVYHGTDTEEVNQLEKDVRKLLEIEYGIDSKK